MVRYEQSEVGVLRVQGRIVVAVSVDRHDAVGVFGYDLAVRVHAECPDQVIVLICLIDDLAFIDIICNVLEDLCRQLDAHANVHAVLLLFHAHFVADLRDPLGAGTSGGQHQIAAAKLFAGGRRHDKSSVLFPRHIGNNRVELHVDLVFAVVVHFAEDPDVAVCTQMPDFGFQQMQVVLEALGLQLGVAGGVELGRCSAHAAEDFVHILHEFHGLVHAHVVVQVAAELCRDVVLAVRQRSRAAVPVHDMARIALDAAFRQATLDWADSLFKPAALVQDQHFRVHFQLGQFVAHEYAAGACSCYDNVVLFHFSTSNISLIRTRSSMSYFTPLISW